MANPTEETALAEYLCERVRDRASGRSENECIRNYPHDVYFIGNLRPRPEDNEEQEQDAGHLRELINKLAPVAFGAEFRFQPESDEVEITVKVKVRWACYYRVFPTLDQQRSHQQQTEPSEKKAETVKADNNIRGTETADPVQAASDSQSTTDQEEPSEEDSTIEAEREKEERLAEIESPEVTESQRDRRRGRTPKDRLFIRFRKIDCQTIGIVTLRRNTTSEWSADHSNLKAALDEETRRVQEVALNDPERLRTAGVTDAQVNVPETALVSEADYNAFIQSLQTDVVPEWRWEVSSEVRPNDETDLADQVVSIEFVNASPRQAPPPPAPDNPNIEAFLFDARTLFQFQNATVLPFELELAPRGFRYDRDLWGRGFNCAVERREKWANTFSTTHTPIYRQMRYVTQTQPQARFEDLYQNPLPRLEAILNAMEAYRQEWFQERQRYVSSDPNWEAEFGSEFDRDLQQFEQEISQFSRGYELIRDDPNVLLAFKLTNETFRRLGAHPDRRKRKDSWRLFQIVFLVSQIPSIAALAHPNSPDASEREMVDIIYFPTGGGKTEAYLGTIVFHCFFDRLRGKAAGVTAWTRFPLRLLTLQQTQRMADVIGVADLVRREQQDQRLSDRGVDGFAVGYLVGAEATPNELVNPSYRYANAKDSVNWSQASDANARQRWKRVISCPHCRTARVHVDFVPKTVRVIHRCTEPTCAFPNGEIPIYVIDNEIYRYLPSVIVGTIDKLASLGNQRKLSQVFGQIDGRCTQHGYYKGKCCQKECSGGQLLQPRRPRGLSSPTLFVQDELHLLKEGLGTFDGHYETFTQQLQQEFDRNAPPLKVIASSATIEAFRRQVKHLYGRHENQARVFPGLGPTLGESFYAQTLDYPQRIFVGIIPHNKTIFNTILELIELYHREVQNLERLSSGTPNPYGGNIDPGTQDWHELLDLYITSLTYFLANRELDSIRTDLEGDVNPNLQRDGFQILEMPQLTGGTSTDEVTSILERLERQNRSNPGADAVLATSMISHGVDVDRFNAMIFYGMPRQNAEYIQASSRVGRSHVGIVFNCLHPARERDQSHYTYFSKFHEFLGQLVEPVAINRWAKFSIDRTLPGLFMAMLLQLIANRSGESNPNRYYMLDFVKQKITEGSLNENNFVPILEQAYRVAGGNRVNEQAFRNQIRLQVQQFLDQILGAGSGEKFVSGVLIPKPMTSLRDVDEAIPIELDSTGTQWATRSGNR
ncbi:MAG: helicase-related protein [Coleofasciculus sp. B1-GNL1-01]|uniref:helicase-related protein n=1 Tax=Coleofasciculus sp. B1-GNL1-01 TaxID=3068484 RepID=UPI0032F1E1FE